MKKFSKKRWMAFLLSLVLLCTTLLSNNMLVMGADGSADAAVTEQAADQEQQSAEAMAAPDVSASPAAESEQPVMEVPASTGTPAVTEQPKAEEETSSVPEQPVVTEAPQPETTPSEAPAQTPEEETPVPETTPETAVSPEATPAPEVTEAPDADQGANEPSAEPTMAPEQEEDGTTEIADEEVPLGNGRDDEWSEEKYPPYLIAANNPGKYFHDSGIWKESSGNGYSYDKYGNLQCNACKILPGVYTDRKTHYAVIRTTNDEKAIAYLRCDLYGGEEPGEKYVPVYYVDEARNTLYKNEEAGGRLFETVIVGKTPEEIPKVENGYWTLGTYDGKEIGNNEEDLKNIQDLGTRVQPEQYSVKEPTYFIWHKNKETSVDFTFKKFFDGASEGSYPAAAFELYLANEAGQIAGEKIGTYYNDENGIVTLKDLKEGVYVLKETVIPNGYLSTNKAAWKIVVKEENEGLKARLYNLSGGEIKAEGDNGYPVINNYSLENHIQKNKTAELTNWEDRTYRIDLYASHNIKVNSPADIVLTVDVSGSMAWMTEKPTGGTTTIKKLTEVDEERYTLRTGGESGLGAWNDYDLFILDEEENEYKPIAYEKETGWHIVKAWGDTPDGGHNPGDKVFDDETLKDDETVYRKGTADRIKLQVLTESIEKFVENLKEVSPESKIAIVPFAKEVKGGDKRLSEARYYTNNFRDTVKLYGGTNQGAGIEKAQRLLSSGNSTNPKYMVLFTDGLNDEGTNPNEAADDAKKQGTIIFAAGLYTKGKADGAKDKLDQWATEGYSYAATSPEELESAFNAIFAEINIGITGVSVKDYISDKFEIIDPETGETLSEGDKVSGGVVRSEANGRMYVEWTGITLGYASSVENGWHQAIHIRAKETYAGGNDVPTNLGNSGVTVNNTFLSFGLSPVVNVLIRFDVPKDGEITIFKGDNLTAIPEGFTNGFDSFKYKEDQLEDFSDLQENKIQLAVYDNAELTDDPVANSLDELKELQPETDTTYYIKAYAVPKTDGSYGGQNCDGKKNPTDAIEPNKSDDNSVYGVTTLTVTVVSGNITVTKKISQEDYELWTQANPSETPEFTFTLLGENDEAVTNAEGHPVQVVAKDFEQEGDSYQATAKFKNLSKGTYSVREEATEDFEMERMKNSADSSNGCDISADKERFEIGLDNAEDRLNKRNGRAEVTNRLEAVNGTITIKKEIKGTPNPELEGDPIFTFKIEQLDEKGTAVKTMYRTVRYDGENTMTAETLTGLPRGTYRISELSAMKYECTDVNAKGCKANIDKENKTATVEIGSDGVNATVTFTNKKTGPNTNTDKDVAVNRFVYDETTGKWTIKQITDPGSVQTPDEDKNSQSADR